MEEIIVGVVGVLQFDVMRFRMESEYGVEIKMENLPYEYIRWVTETPAPLTELNLTSDTKRVKDMKGNPLLLFAHEWSIRTVMERNKGLELAEFSKN